MDKKEIVFRRELLMGMGRYWMADINPENDLTPGVPDITYMMYSPGTETGFLELKVSAYPDKLDVKLEPSQYLWFSTRAGRIPADFLILAGDKMCLFPGTRFNLLREPVQLTLCGAVIPKNNFQQLAAALTNISHRDRFIGN